MILPNDTSASRADTDREALVRDLTAVAQGSESAMARVYASTSAKLNALLIRMLRNPAEAEDVLQDVYLTVWRRGASFDPARASPITWLVTIARNRAIDRIRSRQVVRAAVSDTVDVMGLADPNGSVGEHMEEAERNKRLFTCLDELDGRQREAIRAAFFDGLTYDALAARAGVPVGTMKSWIRRGLLRLRGCMDR